MQANIVTDSDTMAICAMRGTLSCFRAVRMFTQKQLILHPAHNAQYPLISRSFSVKSVDSAYNAACQIIASAETDESLRPALPLLQSAAESGHIAASGRLGRWYLHGIGGLPVNGEKAVQLLHSAAVAGDIEAQYWLGQLYLRGDSLARPCSSPLPVPRPPLRSDDERAALLQAGKAVTKEIRQYRKQAKVNKVRVAQGLTPLPINAINSPKIESAEDPSSAQCISDESLAEYWLKRAAEQDHANAQVALGNICLQSSDEAIVAAGIEWYKLAAQADPPHADALYNLGLIYYNGAWRLETGS